MSQDPNRLSANWPELGTSGHNWMNTMPTYFPPSTQQVQLCQPDQDAFMATVPGPSTRSQYYVPVPKNDSLHDWWQPQIQHQTTVPRIAVYAPRQPSQPFVRSFTPVSQWSRNQAQYLATRPQFRQPQQQLSSYQPSMISSRPVTPVQHTKLPSSRPTARHTTPQGSQQVNPPQTKPKSTVQKSKVDNRFQIPAAISQTQSVQSIQQTEEVVRSRSQTTQNVQQQSLPVVSASTSANFPIPSNLDWTTYRVDRIGTKLPKTTPPPKGTYKVSEGIGRTDYSDPRDFFTPTPEEKREVWKALKPTLEAFYNITMINLNFNEMRCLDQGYNATWDEIKRKLVQWIFDNSKPEAPHAHQVMMHFHQPSHDIPGYATRGTTFHSKQQQQPPLEKADKPRYIVNGVLAVNVDELLFKLERWYGLIEDHEFSPTWPYKRKTNSKDILIQNLDAFPCSRCRGEKNLCYGFRENADRKCTPCSERNLTCDNEEIITSNTQI